MTKIIVATDYSAEADSALNYAAKAASEKGYELILFSLQNVSIHVLNSRLPASEFNVDLEYKEHALRKKSAEVAAHYGIKTTPYFASGFFFEEMEACIANTGANMIVMGMAEKSLEQDMLGNTTTSAINRFKIPVLAIPLNAVYKGIKNIVFACDIATGVHKKVLQKVHDIEEGFGANVEIFNVTSVVNDLARKNNSSIIDESMKGITYYYNDVSSADVIGAIKKEVIAKQADLLSMVPYKYGFWSSLVHKSKTRMMASGNSTPLLSIPL